MLQIGRISVALVFFLSVSCASIGSQKVSGGDRGCASDAPEKIILDSDGAVFWDDGAALAMLLQHPDKAEILGITMVIGNHWPYQGAEYLARVLKAGNREDIPIFIGADQPLRNSKDQLNRLEKELVERGLVPKDGFWKGAYSRSREVRAASDVEPANGEALSGISPSRENAIDFIIKTLIQAPEPITFVEIGPMTNLALAIKKNPAIISKIRRLLFMGGNIRVGGNTTPFAELNFLIDPDAAEFVLTSKISEKLMFPLDLSNQAMVTKERFEALVSKVSPYSKLLNSDRGPKFADATYSVPSWDTTVAAFLIDPSYVMASENLSLNVVDEFGPRYGSVQVNSGKPSNVTVMSKMNSDRFFSILESDITSLPAKR